MPSRSKGSHHREGGLFCVRLTRKAVCGQFSLTASGNEMRLQNFPGCRHPLDMSPVGPSTRTDFGDSCAEACGVNSEKKEASSTAVINGQAGLPKFKLNA